jgi:hypothetical protein
MVVDLSLFAGLQAPAMACGYRPAAATVRKMGSFHMLEPYWPIMASLLRGIVIIRAQGIELPPE